MDLRRIFISFKSSCLRHYSSFSPHKLTQFSTHFQWSTLQENNVTYCRAIHTLFLNRKPLLNDNKYCINGARFAHKESEGLPEISEDDLREKFTRGHGPGGQAVNKTSNCCVLTHVPTGVTVKVHESRSLDENRKLARLRLRQRIDLHVNKENSKREVERREASISRKIKKKKTNERLEKLRAFKEREGLT